METTNFREGFQGSTPNVKLTERFTARQPKLHQLGYHGGRPRHMDTAVDLHDSAETF